MSQHTLFPTMPTVGAGLAHKALKAILVTANSFILSNLSIVENQNARPVVAEWERR